MSKILSQDEIDALLESSSTVAPVQGGGVTRGPNGQMVAAYNFRRPDRISKYATGLAVLVPDLPDAPWRRLVRRRLDVRSTPCTTTCTTQLTSERTPS